MSRTIVTFFKNHQLPLALYRKHQGATALKKPAVTRFCSQFMLLESIKTNQGALRAVVTSPEWTSWVQDHPSDVAEDVADLVLSPSFRKKVWEVIDICTPLVKALKKFDSNAPVASKVYRTVFDAIEALKAVDVPSVSRFSCAYYLLLSYVLQDIVD